MAIRDMKKAEIVKERIVRESPEADIVLLEIDLSSLSSVARFCSQFLSQDLPLNIIMCVRFYSTSWIYAHITLVQLQKLDSTIILLSHPHSFVQWEWDFNEANPWKDTIYITFFAETMQGFSHQILNSQRKRLNWHLLQIF